MPPIHFSVLKITYVPWFHYQRNVASINSPELNPLELYCDTSSGDSFKNGASWSGIN